MVLFCDLDLANAFLADGFDIGDEGIQLGRVLKDGAVFGGSAPGIVDFDPYFRPGLFSDGRNDGSSQEE